MLLVIQIENSKRESAQKVFNMKTKEADVMAKREKPAIEVKVTFTPGYEKRFTAGILKIFEAREQQKEKTAKAAV